MSIRKVLRKRILAYLQIMRFHRPIGGWLLLWPTFWALWAAAQPNAAIRVWPDTRVLVIFTLGVWIMRAAGCVVNDLADHRFDGSVARTQNRPLVIGSLTRIEALGLLALLSLLALSLVLQLNVLTLKLAWVGLALTTTYPFMKRWIHWPQLVLGLAFAWSVPMAYAAQTGHVPPIAWLLFVAAALWPLGYDTIYALMDAQDDQKLCLKSTALWCGDRVAWFIGSVYASMLCLLSIVGFQLERHAIYYIALLAAAGLMAYQLYWISHRANALYLRAFMNNHGVGAVIFLGFLLS